MPLTRPDFAAPLPSLFRRAALIYIPVAALLSLALLVGMHVDRQMRLERTEVREKARIEAARSRITQDFAEAEADLKVIANLPSLNRYLESGSPAWRDELARLLLVLSREKRRYDQIRYLDARGMEVIRVNYHAGAPVIVPAAQLQDKSGRYYFREASALGQSEVFVSPLDLNVEQDKLELPYKPTIRFSMPVFDHAGHKQGVLVLNYLAAGLLQNFRTSLQGSERQAMLLNADGYWLSSPVPEDAWGFMLGKPQRRFGSDYPAEWQTISTRDSGSLQSALGLFVYDTVYPLQRMGGDDRQAQAYLWKLVSFVPAQTLTAATLYHQPGSRAVLAAIYLLLALAAGAVAQLTLARQQAQDRAKRFADAIDKVPAYVYIKDRQHRYVYGNHLVLKLFQRTAETLPGSRDADFFPPEVVARLQAVDDRVLEHGETTQEEIEVAPGTPGHRVYWEVKHPLYDQHGAVWGISGISTDITERKEMEQTLALHGELVRQMSEGMILVSTQDGVIRFANPAFERMFGYAPGELAGKPVATLNAPTDQLLEQTAHAINTILRNKGTWNGEIENIRKDGTRFWCLANVSTFNHPQYGEVWLSIHQDITARKQAENVLHKSSDEIEDLYDNAPCGYHSLDAHGLIVRMNQTELDWLGYRREEVVGSMRYLDLLTPASQQIFHDHYPRFLNSGYVHDLEIEIMRRDGSTLPVLVSSTAVRDAAGQFVMSRTTLFDLTERKKLERELERQARIDMLTGLNNRRHFFELAERELARARRHDELLSALMLDVDHFKQFNDTYGHHVGDQVLQKLSAVCLRTLREIDIVGRIGGEEFAVLLPETGAVQARDTAERLRQALADASLQLAPDTVLHFTVSIGVTGLVAEDISVDAMLKRADAALYTAKNAGRDRVCTG